MRRFTYSNVTATLALFIALGGSAYAAVKVTGSDVVDGSLTGKDIKRKSVSLDRLRTVPEGPQGVAGPKGDPGPAGERGPAGPVDPGQFVSASGLYEVAVGPGGWQSLNTNLRRSNVFGNWVSTSTDDGATLMLDPTLPTKLAGEGMRLRAVTPCWDATANVTISDVIISTFRESATAGDTDVVEQEDTNDHTDAICKRYEFAVPVDMSGGRRVSIRIAAGWTANGATIRIGGATFEFDRAP
jgi:hypothetical protein